MKRRLLLLLLIALSSLAQAQGESSLYVDVAPGKSRGLSATYTRKITRHFEMGGGLSYYKLSGHPVENQRAGAFVDVRPHTGRKAMFFLFTDLGLAYNGGKQQGDVTISPLGVYIAFGPGFCYKINERGMGPYVSMGLYGSTARERSIYPPPPNVYRTVTAYDGYGVISVGFKF